MALHNDGSGWTQVPTQNPGLESNRLYAVDGASDDDVWAVGTSGDGTLIEHWDGTAWTVAPGPSVPNAFTLLSGVSAASAADTWAVGSSQDASSGVTSTVIEHWDGKSWTITPSPNPGETISELFGVSARSADDAWAVGSFDDATGTFHNLVLHWNGTAWSATSAPSPGLKDNTLFSAVSLGRDDAWAVGYAADGTQESAKSPVTLHWDGSVWNLVPSPELSAQLNGVAATPDGQLWAAGYHEVPATTLIERWDGSAWRVIRSQNHQGGVPNYLVGIALGQRAEFAWAVGSGLSTQGQWRTLTEKPCAAS